MALNTSFTIQKSQAFRLRPALHKSKYINIMFLIVIGTIILIVGFVLSRQEHPNARFGVLVRIFGVVLIALGAFTSMFKTIDTGEVGVKTLFGKVDDDVLYSGLHV